MMRDYNKKNLKIQQEPQVTTDCFNYIEKNIIRYKKSKSYTEKFRKFIDKKPPEFLDDKNLKLSVLENVNACGSWLEFRHYNKVDVTKLHSANFCKKDKLCPACAMLRASKQIHKVKNYFDENPSLKKQNWYYIVLPVKHNASEDFETVFNRVRSGLQSLRKSINNNKRGKGKESFFSQFNGLMYSFEVTKTKSGWNNHINLLCCSDTDIKGIYKKGKTTIHKDIMRDWKKYTDNNSFVHSITKIDVKSDDSLVKNLLEIFKYSLKFQDLKNDDLLEVYEKTYNKRLLGAFGSMYGIKTDVDLQDETLGGLEYLEIIYRYNYKTKEYFEHKRKFQKAKNPDYSKDLLNQIKEDNSIIKNKFIEKEIKEEITKKKLKVIPIEIYSSGGKLEKSYLQPNYKNYTDWDIFQKTMSTPIKKE